MPYGSGFALINAQSDHCALRLLLKIKANDNEKSGGYTAHKKIYTGTYVTRYWIPRDKNQPFLMFFGLLVTTLVKEKNTPLVFGCRKIQSHKKEHGEKSCNIFFG
jgi:hypothetical protein